MYKKKKKKKKIRVLMLIIKTISSIVQMLRPRLGRWGIKHKGQMVTEFHILLPIDKIPSVE